MDEEGKVQVRLALDADAAALLLQLAGSPRRQGDYMSKLIRMAASGELGPVGVLDKIGDLERQLAQLRVEVLQGQQYAGRQSQGEHDQGVG